MYSKARVQLGIKGRLYLLVGLFAIGCAALASALIWLQAEHAFEARKQSLKQLVATAHGVLAAHKDMVDAGQMPEAEGRKRALKMIGTMWYGKADYFTARDASGTSLLNPADPSKEGKNRDESTDSKGFHYSRRMTEMVQNPGEGYVTYFTINPATKIDSEKTSYIKLYKPWGIAVAAGVFTDDLTADTYTAMLQAALIALLLVGVLGAVAIWQSRAIVLPLTRLQKAMLDLAERGSTTAILDIERSDEIGAMARAVQVFKNNAADLSTAESEKRRIAAQVEDERQQTEEMRRQNEAEQSAVVGALADNLVRIAQGDLTARIETEFSGRYGQVRSDFNAAIEKLERTIHGVVGSAAAINSGSQEISSASDDLSRRTEQQAASLAETAAALDEITVTVRKTAEGARQAREVVGEARGDAERSGEVVRQAVEAMGRIEKSSQEISQIIGVIDEIAFQTNLLALNAGVEAARAGDAGRGFAVVASEVRALAQRSADAAREIKGLINTSNGEVVNGVKLVAETGETLARIVTRVAEINSVVARIAESAQDQASALQEVNVTVNQMDQVTQQNAAMAEEATAASCSLSQETEQLSGLVGQFQITRGGETAVLRKELQKVAPHAFPAAVRGAGQAAARAPGVAGVRPVPAMARKVANGPAATVQNDADWEEF